MAAGVVVVVLRGGAVVEVEVGLGAAPSPSPSPAHPATVARTRRTPADARLRRPATGPWWHGLPADHGRGALAHDRLAPDGSRSKTSASPLSSHRCSPATEQGSGARRNSSASMSSTAEPARRSAKGGFFAGAHGDRSADVHDEADLGVRGLDNDRADAPGAAGNCERRTECGDVGEAAGDLVGLLDRSEPEGYHDVTLVDPRVQHRVEGDGANRDMAGRRLGKRRPAVVVQSADDLGDGLVRSTNRPAPRPVAAIGSLDQSAGVATDRTWGGSGSARPRGRPRWRRPRTGWCSRGGRSRP